MNDVLRYGRDGAQLMRQDDLVVWTASDLRDAGMKYLALFNLGDEPKKVEFALEAHGLPTREARDLWSGATVANEGARITTAIEPHGCRYLQLN